MRWSINRIKTYVIEDLEYSSTPNNILTYSLRIVDDAKLLLIKIDSDKLLEKRFT